MFSFHFTYTFDSLLPVLSKKLIIYFRNHFKPQTESSKAAQLLQKKYRNGEVSLTNNAKTVWKSVTMFMKHKLDAFQTNSNHLITEHEEKYDKYI